MALKDAQSADMMHPNSRPLIKESSSEMIKNHHLSSTEKGTARRKAVSFQDMHETVLIESALKLSRKEKQKRWVSSDEFAKFKEDCMKLLREIQDTPTDSDIFKYRGLEMIDPASTARRQRHNTNSVVAVLLEQKEQRQQQKRSGGVRGGKIKPKDIRKAYKSTVAESMKEAIENAYIDSKAIKEYLINTEEDVAFEHRHLKPHKIDFWDRSTRRHTSASSGEATASSSYSSFFEKSISKTDPFNRRPSLFRIRSRKDSDLSPFESSTSSSSC